MARTFDSARLKLKRAYQHISDLDIKRATFLDTRPCKVRAKYNPQSDRTGYIVEHLEDVPPDLSLVAGDAIHNFRSALDHLVASLVAANHQPVTSLTAFPVFESFSKDEIKSSRKIKGMSLPDKELLSSADLYDGRYIDLWGLHRLDIVDKHKLLIIHAISVDAMNYRFSDAELEDAIGQKGVFGNPASTEKKTITIPFLDTFPVPKVGNEIFSMSGNMEQEQDAQPGFDIAFGDVEIMKGKLVIPTMDGWRDLAEKIIGQFE